MANSGNNWNVIIINSLTGEVIVAFTDNNISVHNDY
jgi:hypothetical protein